MRYFIISYAFYDDGHLYLANSTVESTEYPSFEKFRLSIDKPQLTIVNIIEVKKKDILSFKAQ